MVTLCQLYHLKWCTSLWNLQIDWNVAATCYMIYMCWQLTLDQIPHAPQLTEMTLSFELTLVCSKAVLRTGICTHPALTKWLKKMKAVPWTSLMCEHTCSLQCWLMGKWGSLYFSVYFCLCSKFSIINGFKSYQWLKHQWV